MIQRERLKELIIDFCNKKGRRTFSLRELNEEYGDYSQISIGGRTPHATVRRLIRELPRNEFLYVHGNTGRYTLKFTDLLDIEQDDLGRLDLSEEPPGKKEYLVEVFARKSKWAIEAKNAFGNHCLMAGCGNTFQKPDNTPYIEVHHIMPLHLGGENKLSNLSVLCAHHHRMAHFARKNDTVEIRHYLLTKVKRLLRRAR